MLSGSGTHRPRRHHGRVIATVMIAATVALITAFITASAGARVAHRSAACATTSELSEHLTGSDLPFLRRFLPCEVEKLRAAGAGRLATSAKLSAEAVGFLNADATVSATGIIPVLTKQENSAGSRFCPLTYRDNLQVGDSSPPPALTPALIARTLTADARKYGIWRERGTVFGFGLARHLLVNDPRTFDPVAFAVLLVHCS